MLGELFDNVDPTCQLCGKGAVTLERQTTKFVGRHPTTSCLWTCHTVQTNDSRQRQLSVGRRGMSLSVPAADKHPGTLNDTRHSAAGASLSSKMAPCRKKRALSAIALYLALDSDDEDERARKERTLWSRKWVLRRQSMGCYENLMRELALEDAEGYRRWIRMDTGTFENLLGKVRPLITKQDTNFRRAIDAGERLAVTLRYLATGDSMMSLQYAFRLAHNTISNIIAEVCVAIFEVLKDDFVRVPSVPSEWKAVAEKFYALWQFPHCIGALDGKHVVILPPPQTGAMYRNYKGTFSIVLMALVDADLNFLYVDVGRNGRMNDSSIWNSCCLKMELERSPPVLPEPERLPNSSKVAPYVIVGDEGFGLKDYLMRPYPARDLNTDSRIFNYRLSRARRTAENAFGVLCNRWQIFRAPLRHTPERATKIILATVALHNFLRALKPTRLLYLPPETIDVEDLATGTVRPGSWRQGVSEHGAMRPLARPGGNCSNSAKAVRELYTEYFNYEGQVGWQWKMI